jgi:hypothetical protein
MDLIEIKKDEIQTLKRKIETLEKELTDQFDEPNDSEEDHEFYNDVNFSHCDFGILKKFNKYIVKVTGFVKSDKYDRKREVSYDVCNDAYDSWHSLEITEIKKENDNNIDLTKIVSESTLKDRAFDIDIDDDDEYLTETSTTIKWNRYNNTLEKTTFYDTILYVYILKGFTEFWS